MSSKLVWPTAPDSVTGWLDFEANVILLDPVEGHWRVRNHAVESFELDLNIGFELAVARTSVRRLNTERRLIVIANHLSRTPTRLDQPSVAQFDLAGSGHFQLVAGKTR